MEDRIWWNLSEEYRDAWFSPFVERAQGIHASNSELYRVLAGASLDVVQICEGERVSLRREILRVCPDARMSPMHLTVDVRDSHVEILWRTVKGACRKIDLPGDLPTHPVPLAQVDCSWNPYLLRGAHADERELIVHHNRQVMAMRDLWSRYQEMQLTSDALLKWTTRPSRES
ncbi:hypothetical protein WCE37_01060 [Luteimonas sp. MJ250]|uniref:hypothetical protein n=1 Tax=Luteimonas sp. MJ250 TaxID=3129236 RepID=UPI0031BA85A0